MRVIGIIGAGYSGSTLLAFMLGSLPGVKTCGESYHLITKKKPVGCRVCPEGTCDVYSPQFKAGVTFRDGWKRIAARLNTDTLVVSEKGPAIYRQFLAGNEDLDISFVVLHKRPEAFVFSSQRHSNATSSTSGLGFWVNRNRESLELIRGGGYRHVGVSFEELTASPAAVLERICNRLDLPYLSSAVEYWNFEHHSISGNFSAHINLWGLDDPRTMAALDAKGAGWEHYRKMYRRVIPSSSVALPFTAGQLAAIRGFPGVAEIAAALTAANKEERA